jgi:hypothetical protein
MFTFRNQAIVIRFGKLFLFLIGESCPFWETEIGCKDTKFPEYHQNLSRKK